MQKESSTLFQQTEPNDTVLKYMLGLQKIIEL